MREVEIEHGGVTEVIKTIDIECKGFREKWFRGQPRYEYNLLPSIFRQGLNYGGMSYDEAGMYHDFVRRCYDYSASHKTLVDWLTIMQHYGLPTRLLDWTSNLLVSLYFSCKSDDDYDSSVYVIDPSNLGTDVPYYHELQILASSHDSFYEKLFSYLSGKYGETNVKINGLLLSDIQRSEIGICKFVLSDSSRMLKSVDIKSRITEDVVLIDQDTQKQIFEKWESIREEFSSVIRVNPPSLNKRLASQHGFFTLHGGAFCNGRLYIPVIDLEKSSIAKILKVRIERTSKKRIAHELDLCGIRECTLFPETEYLAKDIRNSFTSHPSTA